MADRLEPAFSIPKDFKIHEVRPRAPAVLQGAAALAAAPPPPPLGPLAAFEGTWIGIGFNTIFRPQKQTFPLPHPAPGDNLLELNLTSETLSFSSSLGSIPNRGMLQDDIFLNGVPYVQSINDVTNPAPPTGIHFEPGIWLIAPATTNPQEPISLARMASIPHGVTIVAQGVALPAKAGPPGIHSVDITPTPVGGGAPIKFPSQTAANQNTAHPARPHALDECRHDYAGLVGRPEPAAQERHRGAEHSVHDHDRREHQSGLAAVRRRYRQYRVSSWERCRDDPKRERRHDVRGVLDRNCRAPTSHRLSERKCSDDGQAPRSAFWTSSTIVPPRSAHPTDGSTHHQSDLDTNPVQPDRHPQLQRLELAACFGRYIGAG